MVVMISELRDILRVKGIAPQEEWLLQCTEYLSRQGSRPADLSDIAGKSFSLFLEQDFYEAASGVLPINFRNVSNGVLDGLYILQIDEAVNIGVSAYSEYRNSDNINRLLKIFLTDGKQQIIGIEHRRIPDLPSNVQPGMKIAVYDAPYRAGTLLLSPQCVRVLGGCSPRLITLREGSQQTRNTAESGNAVTDSILPTAIDSRSNVSFPPKPVNVAVTGRSDPPDTAIPMVLAPEPPLPTAARVVTHRPLATTTTSQREQPESFPTFTNPIRNSSSDHMSTNAVTGSMTRANSESTAYRWESLLPSAAGHASAQVSSVYDYDFTQCGDGEEEDKRVEVQESSAMMRWPPIVSSASTRTGAGAGTGTGATLDPRRRVYDDPVTTIDLSQSSPPPPLPPVNTMHREGSHTYDMMDADVVVVDQKMKQHEQHESYNYIPVASKEDVPLLRTMNPQPIDSYRRSPPMDLCLSPGELNLSAFIPDGDLPAANTISSQPSLSYFRSLLYSSSSSSPSLARIRFVVADVLQVSPDGCSAEVDADDGDGVVQMTISKTVLDAFLGNHFAHGTAAIAAALEHLHGIFWVERRKGLEASPSSWVLVAVAFATHANDSQRITDNSAPLKSISVADLCRHIDR